MSLHKRLLAQLNGKMGPALRVACMDVGEGREQGCGSFADRDVGKGREQGCGSFAYRDVGKGHEQGCGSFAPETVPLGAADNSFRTTNLRASRLDCRCFSGSSNDLNRVNRPKSCLPR